jgi:hypothetical protein
MAYESLIEDATNPPPPPAAEQPTSLGAMVDRATDPVQSYLHESRLKARDWSEVEKTIRDESPDVDPEPLRQSYQMDRARARFKDGYEDIPTYIFRRSIPGISAGYEFGESLRYQRAKSRFNEGKASEADITDIAAYERLQEIDKERNVGEAVVSGLARVPAILGEGAAAAGLFAKPAQVGLRGAGATAPSIFTKAGVKAAVRAAPGEIGRETLRTPAMPTMWLASAAKRAEENGGEWWEGKNLGVAMAFGAVQTAVLGHSMKLGQQIKGGRLAQAGTAAGAGFSEQQLGDVAVSLVDEALPRAYQTRTRYGVIGNLARGEYGEALKQSATQVVTFGAFAGMNKRPTGPLYEAYANAVDHLADQKYQQKNIDAYLHQIGGRLDTAMRARPSLTAGEAKSIFEGMPDSPVRDYALALADTLPNQTWSAPRTVQRGLEAKVGHEVAKNRRELSAQEYASFKTVEDVVGRIEQEAKDVESVDGLLGLLEWSLVRDVAGMHEAPRKPADLPAAEQLDALYAKLPAGKDIGVKDLKKMSPVDLRRLQDAGAITITPERTIRKTEGWRLGDRAIEPPEPPGKGTAAQPPGPAPTVGPNDTAGQVRAAFEGLGSGIKAASEERTMRDVAQLGYTSFRNPAAADLFAQNHPDWVRENVGYETRFRPPDAPGSPVPADRPPEPQPDDPTGLRGIGGKDGMGTAIADNMYQMFKERLDAGKSTEAGGVRTPVMAALAAERARGGVRTVEEIRKFVADFQARRAGGTPTEPPPSIGTAKERSQAMQEAFTRVQAGEKAVYVDMDVDNMAGLAREVGDADAAAYVREMAEIYREELAKVGAKVDVFRHAGDPKGDEHSAVVIGADKAAVERALLEARVRIADLGAREGLSHLEHGKGGDRPKGVGLTAFAEEIKPGMDARTIFAEAEAGTESRKGVPLDMLAKRLGIPIEPPPKMGSQTIERLAAKARERSRTTKANEPPRPKGKSVETEPMTEAERASLAASEAIKAAEDRRRAERVSRGLTPDPETPSVKKPKFSKAGTAYAQSLLKEIARRRREGLPIEGDTLEAQAARAEAAEAERLEVLRRGPEKPVQKSQEQLSQEMLARRGLMRKMGTRPKAAEAQEFLERTDPRELGIDPKASEPRLENVVKPKETFPDVFDPRDPRLIAEAMGEAGERRRAKEEAAKTPEQKAADAERQRKIDELTREGEEAYRKEQAARKARRRAQESAWETAARKLTNKHSWTELVAMARSMGITDAANDTKASLARKIEYRRMKRAQKPAEPSYLASEAQRDFESEIPDAVMIASKEAPAEPARPAEPTGDDLRARAEASRREFVERNRAARLEREKAAKEAEKKRKAGILDQRLKNLKQRKMEAGTLIEKIRKLGGVSRESYAGLGLDVKTAMETPGIKPIFQDTQGFLSTRSVEDLIPELVRSGDLVEVPGEHLHDTLRRKLEGGESVRSQEGIESKEGQAELAEGEESFYRDVEGAEFAKMTPEEIAAQERAYEEAEKRRATMTADEFWDDLSEGGDRLGLTPPTFVMGNWGRVFGDIGKAARKWLTSAGDLPKKDFREKIAHDGRVAAYAQDVANIEKDLRKVIGRYDYLSDAQLARLDDALRGDANALALIQRDKPEAVPIIQEMRRQVDALSAALIQSGAVQGSMVATVASNMGVYLHRRYRVFEDAAWGEKVDPAVRNRFKSWLWAQLANQAQGPIDPDRVEGMTKALLTNGTAAENPISFLSRAKLGSKELAILTRRKDVPAELRALWGEYKDPLVNYTHSVHRMSHLLSNHVFLSRVAAAGRGKHFFSEDELGQFQRLYPDENPVQIAETDAKTKGPKHGLTSPMGPLAGLYTTLPIKQAYEAIYKKQELPGWLRTYMRFLAVPKYGKTVLNLPAGPARNFAGNFGFALANGHFRLGNAMAAFRSLADDSPQGRAYYRDLIQRGLAGESLEANEFRATIKDVLGARDLTQMASQLNSRYERMTLAVGKQALELSQKLYQAADTVWKVYAFENEKSRYREAKPGWSDEQVAAHAAEVVRNVYPTYSMIPKAGQALRRMPLIAPFSSFPAEVVRTSYHTIRQALRELKDPDTRAIGWTRLAGSGMAATISAAASAATAALVGMDREDEEALRRFLPSWSKDHPLAHMGRDAKGNPLYVDMGVTDPHAFLAEPVYAAMRADDPEQGALQAALAVGKPFFTEELLTERLLDVARNEKREGGQVWNEQLSPLTKMGSGAQHVAGAFVPGGVTAARRFGMGLTGTPEQKTGRVYDPAHEAVAMTGQRISPVDLTRSLEYKGRSFQTGKVEAARISTEVQRARGMVSDEELQKAYEKSEAARRKLFDDLRLDVLAAERLGVDRKDIIKSLKAGGVSEQDTLHLLHGRYVPRQPELVPLPDRGEAARRLGTIRQGLRR